MGTLTTGASAAVLLAAWLGAPEDEFRQQVAPLLERRCVSCHSAELAKGGLALDTAESLRRGGESGPVVVPGKPAASLLLDYIAGDRPEMPKSGPPLKPQEVAVLRAWVEQGAAWPEGLALQERPAADNDWWSLRPLESPDLPDVPPSGQSHVRNPVDAFILQQLAAKALTPSPEADRRTLIRRLSFDLIGLPPTPEEISRFVADSAPDAYEQLVERLLASPQYGERWARHWLDVVHFGETHGYDKDKLRLNAWPYRDYVIRALNSDKPYSQFVREQLAGDVVAPHSMDGTTALGFIAAGPWDFIGHVEVPESKTDGKIARNLDRDDMVVNALNSFCSVTVQCARCHAHKFDPISQADYYRLQAVFAAVDRTELTFDREPEVGQRRQTLLADQRRLERSVEQLASQVKELAGPRYQEITARLDALNRQDRSGFRPPPEHGYHSQIEPRDDLEKWVQIDLGAATSLQRLLLRPCYDDFNSIGAGFGFPKRLRIEVSDDPGFATNVVTLVDRTQSDLPNPGLSPQQFEVQGAGRYLRITATRLAPRQNDFIFALAEVEVLDVEGVNVARGQPVSALDTIEAPIRWGRSNLVDGIAPQAPGAESVAEKGRLEEERESLIRARVPRDVWLAQQQTDTELASVRGALAALPAPEMVYAAAIHHGSGAFRGTGPDGGRPRPIHVLKRGNVTQPADEVQAGAPLLVPGWSAEFELPADHSESARREALAEWIVDSRNPLTWRSIVNRVWQYHFGRGLVDSPNDFGRMGQTPSHPELLDWLAADFRDQGQSLKRLHRWIVLSATYRQVSLDRPEATVVDAGNALLWRANRRKLDAEALRDSLLAVSGRLNLQLGGPSFQDFVVERPEHSPHYEYRLHDPRDVRAHRRSVYRFLARSQPQPFMTTLDCADPSMSIDKRNETINALQALALLNNGLILMAAEEFAGQLQTETSVSDSSQALEQQLQRGFERALGRPPQPEELSSLVEYAQQFGLANACRLLFNLNEFAFVD